MVISHNSLAPAIHPQYRRTRTPRHRTTGHPILLIVASVAGLAALTLAVAVGFSGLFV
jgi:hypothetical protein